MNATPASTIEVYRLTPRNIISLTNKDTGDITGDVFFKINEYDLPLRCLNGSSSAHACGCFLDVNDVAIRFQVELRLRANEPYRG